MSNYHIGEVGNNHIIDNSLVNNDIIYSGISKHNVQNTSFDPYNTNYNSIEGVNNLIDINNMNLYNKVNQPSEINKSQDNNINIEFVENHLKYEKYNYFIDMENNTQPNLDKTLDDVAVKLTNAAETGVKVFDSFLTSLSPKVENVLNSVIKEQKSFNEKTCAKPNNQQQIYFINETDSKILIVCEIPRVEKNNCHVKLDSNNILKINAKTSPFPETSKLSQYNFIEQRDYTFEIKLTKEINSKMIIAKIVDGVLYIEISKKLINIEDINIL